MLKEWQFNVLFFVGVGGAVLLLIGPEIGLQFGQNPVAVGGVGSILAYILTQKNALTRDDKEKKTKRKGDQKEVDDDGTG